MSVEASFGFTIEYVKDMAAAKRFYTDVLGLAVEREHPVFVQFDGFAIAGDEAVGGRREEDEVYWLVDDAAAALAALEPRAEISVPLRTLPFGTVFGVKDPDGRTRYLLELAKDRPSQPAR
jgi:catechol 2,3-dioxygenase-like lactoylglutathione lyase family enzyme